MGWLNVLSFGRLIAGNDNPRLPTIKVRAHHRVNHERSLNSDLT